VDVVRITGRQTALDLYNLFPEETREWVEKVVKENEAKGKEAALRPNGGHRLQFTCPRLV
jgi:hypothetical protein